MDVEKKWTWRKIVLGLHKPIKLPKENRPQLIVVIDTEEEFDWNAPADRKATGVTAMDYITRAQDIFDEYGIKPCYVVDYPVVSQEGGYRALKKIFDEGRCEIGAHLHPWVSPPFDEEMKPSNTFPGNLDPQTEKAKLELLTSQIEKVFGQRPTTYKAGRYGVGSNTTAILEELGFEIDLSLCPPVDYSAQAGPDFSNCHAEPFWFGREESLLEIPVTGAFVGWAGAMAKPIYNLAMMFKQFKLPGIFSRLSLVDRLMLSPEGFSSKDHIKLTQSLYDQGVRTFTWSFHSPSVVPGHTSYVRDEQELEEFLGTFRTFFDFFFNQLNGEATTPTELRSQLRGLK
jgi:hypothetical protein